MDKAHRKANEPNKRRRRRDVSTPIEERDQIEGGRPLIEVVLEVDDPAAPRPTPRRQKHRPL